MAAPDGGWGWMVVLGCFLTFFICGGLERCFGVWYVELLDLYEAGAALTAWTIGIQSALRLMLFPVDAVLYTRFSARLLMMAGGALMSVGIFLSAFAANIGVFFLTFSIVGGLGQSLAIFSAQIVLSEYFEKRRFLALALASCGGGSGVFAMSTLLAYLFVNFTYFEAVVMLAGIGLHSVVGGALCFPVYEPISGADSGKQPQADNQELLATSAGVEEGRNSSRPPLQLRKLSGKRRFETDVLRNPVLILYVLGAIVALMGAFPITQLIVDYAVEQGERLETASMMLTASGVMEVATRIALGFILNLAAVKPHLIVVWNMSFVLFGLSALGVAFSTKLWQFILCLFFNAVAHSVARSFQVAMIALVFETSAFASAYSVYGNAVGVGILSGTVLSGHIRDSSGSYFNSYLLMTSLCLLSSGFYWTNFVLIKRLKSNGRYRLVRSVETVR